jgi:hypothetical protein
MVPLGKYNIPQPGKSYPCINRNTFPSYEGHTKSLVSIGFFSVFEMFGKKMAAIPYIFS